MGRTLSVSVINEKKVLHKIQNSKRNKTRWSKVELETTTEEVYPEFAEMEETSSKEAESRDLFGLDQGVLASLFQMTLQKGDQKFEDAVAFNTLSFALAMESSAELLPPKSMSEDYQLFPDYVPPQIQNANFVDDDNISTAFPVLEVPQKIIQEKTIGLSGKKRISTQDDEVTKKFEEIIKIYQSSTAIREFSAYSGIPTFYPERN